MKKHIKTKSLACLMLVLMLLAGCASNPPAASKSAAPAASSASVAPAQGSSSAPAPAATAFPEKGKQVKLVITSGVGGSDDITARTIAPFLAKYLGATIVPENMEGASNRKAMNYVFGAKPDGYTIVFSTHPSRVIGEMMYPEDSKFKMSEFTPLGVFTAGDTRTVFVKADSPINTIQDLINASKTKTLNAAGGGGVGSGSHVAAVLLNDKVGVKTQFIPFEGAAQVLGAILGKQCDYGMEPISSIVRGKQNGDYKVLAIYANQRSPLLPDVPTLKELGFEGCVLDSMTAVYAPPGTPKNIADAYTAAIKKCFDDQEFLKACKDKNLMTYFMDNVQLADETKKAYVDFGKILPRLIQDKEAAAKK